MEVIHATWEKRNLGLDAYEINLNEKDCTNENEIIEDIVFCENNKTLITMKMPVGHIALLHKLEDIGYRFVETQFSMRKKLKNYVCPQIVRVCGRHLAQKRINKTEKDWLAVTDMISSGMFHTDRIYLDEIFSEDIACKRYKNWILDLMNNDNSEMNLYYDEDKPVGFDTVLLDNDRMVANGILGGIFENYMENGYGIMMFDSILRNLSSRGYKKIETHISSNNIDIITTNLYFGYEILAEQYVLRKLCR